MESFKAFSLVFSCLGCSVSLSICSASFLIRSLSFFTSKISLSSRFVLSSICFVRSSICFIRHSLCSLRCSSSGSRRQLSVAPKWRALLHAPSKNCRHRGSDERDAPLLLDVDGTPGDGEVVIGRKEGDQAEGKAAAGLGETEAVETKERSAPWAR